MLFLTDDKSLHRRPAISPDGKLLAWQTNMNGKDDEIYLANIDGSNPKNLTDAPGDAWPVQFLDLETLAPADVGWAAAPPADLRTPDFKQGRAGFQHMRDYGVAKGVAAETITVSLPDRRDRIDGFVAEDDTVWMRFKVAGTQSGKLYGLPPSGKRVEAAEIGIMRFADGKWKEAWYFGDELGLMLQLDALHMLEA